jgi:L-ascorbate metabolism protein UlaG (beta-lactamase superfamily)
MRITRFTHACVRVEDAGFSIHDAMVNERGLASVNGWLAQETASYRWLAPRETTVTGPGAV